MDKIVDAAYIHIPFCKKICHYCAFNKYLYDGQPVEQYLSALDQEIAAYHLKRKPMDTVYVGGGTPSCLNLQELDNLLHVLHRHMHIDSSTEFTLEVNPGELTKEKCQLLFDYGVNRISMGVQSFNDKLLRRIGRNHRSHHVYECIEWLRQVGFENISIDLIFRLPDQTLSDFNESLEKALSLDLPHYSLYSLIIEQQTVFQQLMREGKLPLPSEDIDADMFQLAIARLHEAHIYQYEVSNFAKAGYQSRHNLKYWHYQDYYGFGAGSHGFLNQTRYHNHGPVHHYLSAVNERQQAIIHKEQLSLNDQMEEFIFLALRTVEGVNLASFESRFETDALSLFGSFFEQQIAKGLMSIKGQQIALTQRGLFLADLVFRDLIGWLK